MRFNAIKSGLCYALVLLLHLLPTLLHAQENSSIVKGVVQNNNGDVLAGVSVVIRNTSNNFTSGTSTDSTGVFTFSRVPAGGPYSFTFSIVGYENQTLGGYNIKNDVTLSLIVKMKELSNTLDQVV